MRTGLNRRGNLLLIVTILILVGSPPSFARADDFSAMNGLGEEISLFEEIPSVFGASKYEQKVTEAPSSVNIVTSAEIERYGYRTLADILRSLRSFHVTNDHNYEYVAVRGFGSPGDYNSRVLVLVDGHRINDNIYGAVEIGHDFPLDISLIDRVEVIRGPSSSLYGAGAFFGVINVISKRGRDYQGVEVSGEAASHDSYLGSVSYGDRYRGGLELLISATAYDSAGRNWHYPEFDDPAQNNGNSEGNDEESSYNTFLKASFSDFTLSAAYTRREKEIPTAAWETAFNDPGNETVDERAYLDLQYERSFEAGWSLLARGFYDHYDYDGDYPYDTADYEADPDADPDIVMAKDYGDGRWWGAEVQVGKRLGERHQLIAGTEYERNSRQDQGAFDEEPFWEYYKDERDSDYWAAYLQDEFRILDNLILNVGVRHDEYDTFGGTTNPRLALIHTPFEKTTLKFLYGEAFRAPNAYELYYHDGGLTSKPNPDLDPETIKTYEVVLEQYLGDNLRGVAAGFYYEIEDLINLTTDPADDLLVYRNMDEAEAWGMELELEGKSKNGVGGRISYTFQEAENKSTGKRLTNSPKHLAKINLTVPLWEDKVIAGIEEQYTSRRKTLSDGETDDFAVTNLTLFSQNLLEGLEVSGSVYNLFDKKFSDPGGEEHYQDALEQDGRTFRLKLSYLF